MAVAQAAGQFQWAPVYLDSRRGSDGIDGVHAAGSAAVLVVDVAAVQREHERSTAAQQRHQEEEEDWQQLEQMFSFYFSIM